MQLTIGLSPGPYSRFASTMTVPARLPVRVDDADEPVLATVLDYEVLPHELRFTIEIPAGGGADARALSLFASTLAA